LTTKLIFDKLKFRWKLLKLPEDTKFRNLSRKNTTLKIPLKIVL